MCPPLTVKHQNGKLGRTPGDIPCGGLPRIEDLNSVFSVYGEGFGRGYARPVTPNGIMFYNVHRLVGHIERVEIANEPNFSTMELRIEYLSNKLTEDGFKKKLQQLEKRREKRRDIRNIYTMFSHTCSDIIRQLLQEPSKINNLVDILNNLKNYTNETFRTIQNRYSSIAPMISENWDLS